MYIKRLSRNVYDVFTGTDWMNWTRVKRENNGIRFIAGGYLTHESLIQVKERLLQK